MIQPRYLRWLFLATAAALFLTPVHAEDPPAQAKGNPFLEDKAAIDDGERTYRARCFGCHFRAGGRGPNIFRSKLSEDRFFETVKKGGGSGMPAWGTTLSDEDIWKVHAFVMSRDRL